MKIYLTYSFAAITAAATPTSAQTTFQPRLRTLSGVSPDESNFGAASSLSPMSMPMSMALSSVIAFAESNPGSSSKSSKSSKVGKSQKALALVPAPLQLTNLQTIDFEEVDSTKFNIGLSLEVADTSTTDAWLRAQAKWMSVITGDLESRVPTTNNERDDPCANKLPDVIDDTHICGRDIYIDGVRESSNILGFGGPMSARIIRDENNIIVGLTTITGQMNFDYEDIPFMVGSGFWETIVLHEMGHVLGIGNLWGVFGLLVDENSTYTGENGIQIWQGDWGCVGTPPVETDFGPGIAGRHWDEECLDRELMSVLNRDGAFQPLSKLTVASLEDLGYEVDYTAADDYDGHDTTCCFPDTNDNLSSSKPSQPTLSESAKAYATAYGQQVLNERKRPAAQVEDIQEESSDIGMYVGDKIVTILIQEDGYLYNVHVSSE